jgi:hypothetical protein
MTHVIPGVNVNTVFTDALWWLKVSGLKERSRNGPVLVAPGPVISEYRRPWERLVFNPDRDANHVFHLMESIWMLAGQNDVRWLLPFNARFVDYTDNGVTQHGAYGYRWRDFFNVDQIHDVIEELRANPDSRRAVIGMWDPEFDLRAPVRDVPCNTHIYFDCRGGKLNMTVCNRSNDALWGCYGANVVHMSVLQEVIAWGVGVPIGVYRQFSNNLHVYTDLPMAATLLAHPPADSHNLYEYEGVRVIPLLTGDEEWADLIEDCDAFVLQGTNVASTAPALRTHFMRSVAQPLYNGYLARKAGQSVDWDSIPHCDWKVAFQQ